jgi:hypothetical protein
MEAQIVVSDGRTQQERRRAVDQQLQMGKEAGITVEKAIGRPGRGADVPMTIKNGKRIVVLERQPWSRGASGRRNVERRLILGGRRVLERVCRGFQERPFRPSLPPPNLDPWAAESFPLHSDRWRGKLPLPSPGA